QSLKLMQIPLTIFISALIGFAGLLGSIIGVYVSLTNTITNCAARIAELERKVLKTESRLDEHDDRMNSMFMEIKDGIHRLEIMIEKLR
ncbi:MAG TPA: hypothetical protein VG603_13875, partial [Chitinophagales bacterium]|nr:hypothetical protein [Chitinophagales bacterium]